MVNVYWAGGEDIDCFQVGGVGVATTANFFRASYARCCLATGTNTSGYWQNYISFNQSQFWFTGRCTGAISTMTNGNNMVRFIDSSNIVRIAVKATGTAQLGVFTVNAAGTQVQLGSSFSYIPTVAVSPFVPDKIDIFVNYAVAGSLTLYINGNQQFTYTGDITTDGVTALAGFRLSTILAVNNGAAWSEIVVCDTDTRSMSLQTLAPVANGNTHNFDTGSPAAANINEIILNDATLDASTTAGQIDQYTIPSIAAGTYSIVAVGVSARLQKGASGPSKMDLNVRSGGTDYYSADQSLTTSWADYQNWWTTDPNTSVSWAALPTNIGLKSVT